MDIDPLQDPDDFFDAYERLENAKREIKKLIGGNVDAVNQQRQSLDRSHRPGILGKSYSYKHRHSSNPSQNDDVLVPLQEARALGNSNFHKDNPLNNLNGPDFMLAPGDGMKTGNELGSILDELLSCKYEDLDGEGAMNLLQERLKIQPLDAQSLFIAEDNNATRTSSTSVLEETQLESREDSASTHELLSPAKRKVRSPVGHELVATFSISPTPLSPFSSVALLMRRTRKDLLDSPDVYVFSPPEASVVQSEELLHKQVHVSKDSTDLDSHAGTPEPVINARDDALSMTEENYSLSGQLVNKDLPNAKCRDKENEGPQPDKKIPDNNGNSNDNEGDLPTPYVPEHDARDNASRPNHASSGDQDQAFEKIQVLLETLRTSKRNAAECIKKSHPMRKSLAECGSSFENGVRRSKRIKSRPLEYWKGERLLYGRVHDSLKLIGVKCLSPGKGDTVLKVKPYISSESSEIKELLDRAARY